MECGQLAAALPKRSLPPKSNSVAMPGQTASLPASNPSTQEFPTQPPPAPRHRIPRYVMRYLPALKLFAMGSPGYPSPNRAVVRRASTHSALYFALLFTSCIAIPHSLPAQTITFGSASTPMSSPMVPSGPDSIHGTVLNRVTREPIPRALVYSPDNRYAVLTDDRGQFEFKFPPKDPSPPPTPSSPDDQETFRAIRIWYARNLRPQVFLVKKPGFLETQNPTPVSGTDSGRAELVLMLDPASHIVGHVLLPESDKGNRIQLQLFRQEFGNGHEQWRQMENFTTWANGEFRFTDLPAGTYKLLTLEQMEGDPAIFNPRNQLYGYPPVFYPNSNDFSTATPIQLAPGATFEADISVNRHAYYPVKITVSNPPSAGFPMVQVYPQAHPGPGYSLGYDSGEQQVQGFLPDGAYTLKLSTFNGQEGSSGFLNFSVRGGPVVGQSISMFPNLSLFVTVKLEMELEQPRFAFSGLTNDPGNPPVNNPNNYVSVVLNPTEQFGMSQTPNSQPVQGQADSLVLNNVSPGTYWVQFNSGIAYVSSATWGGADVLHHPMTVGQSGPNTPVEITLRNDGAEVSGYVRSPQNANPPAPNAQQKTVPQAFIYFLPLNDSEGQFRQTQTGQDGTFSSSQIAPGAYRILAFEQANPLLALSIPEALHKYESSGVVVTLAPSQNETLSAPLVPVTEP